ncbi:uncharacterized protein BT62DRAFT_938301 [Guyanagaster necrorhizus]|uniref:Uncharacterized protein n=1 Tax=Guyanagaster necrorhizus TaxID=856835 RepID=A0A9P8ALW7_9AGAR|nr:uncharacterized protein BT62DRAFT_938301 [Guyanagaster necrorhizus MCA 3950]KAG7440104.1 hypothetical protein BT62DRAFT_938301 [Guyanagaster necrorhizus MCA 3950]
MTSDSSTSTTPSILTPESTGTSPEPPLSTTPAMKKSRRQTAFYPNMNPSNKTQNPFSRSAAKRQSVMALGSIEHLQYYFTKTGIAAKKNNLGKPVKGLVPALGGKSHIRNNSSLSSLPELRLPPTPVVPDPHGPAFLPFVKTYETDPESLLPGVVEDLTAVARAWRIDLPLNSEILGGESFDVLSLLKITTTAIRAVRNYVVSLPDESAGTIRAQFRSKVLGPRAIRSPTQSQSGSSPDPLTLIRRSALEVLTVLRVLEEKSRLPLSNEAYDAQSDGANSRNGDGPSRIASPSIRSDKLPSEEDDLHVHEVDPDTAVSFTLMQVQGRYTSVPVWEDEDEQSDSGEDDQRDRWDEKLVVGSGWLYRQDVKWEELEKERKTIGSYLDVVDEVLFEGKKDGSRGWEREARKAAQRGNKRRVSAGDAEGKGFGLSPVSEGKRRVSTGILDFQITEEPEDVEDIAEEIEDSTDDEDLPEWAKRHTFEGDELGRAHALLAALLPPPLREALAPASPRSAFLDSLSSGQLLCSAYNIGVRKSKKPWGYVNKDGVHDILSLEKAEKESGNSETPKKGWTFRRTDNLRLWVGALKLRYMLPIVVPTQVLPPSHSGPGHSPSGSPQASQTRFPGGTSEPPIMFDAKVVAGKSEEWEDMLEAVLMRWMRKVVDERRNES